MVSRFIKDDRLHRAFSIQPLLVGGNLLRSTSLEKTLAKPEPSTNASTNARVCGFTIWRRRRRIDQERRGLAHDRQAAHEE
jgi:hypothetical protein